MIEDKLLIWRFKRGSTDALRRIYEKYKNDLLKLALVLVNDINTAEDVVQDVFVIFAQSKANISTTGNLKSFLSTCVANRIRNLKRDRQRHESYSTDKLDSVSANLKSPRQWALISEQLEVLNNAMAQLPQQQREVIALYMQGEMTFKQIARLQGASINTIQGQYRYGLSKLRTLLNSEVTK